jgi:hypothetical protein
MLEFRRDAEAIIRKAQRGQRMILTYRGKPVLRLEPILGDEPVDDDPIYHLDEIAENQTKAAELNNEQIDQILYGA